MPVSIEDLNDALTVSDVAAIVDRDEYTVRRWIRTGQLEAFRLGAGSRGSWRVTRRALTEYVNKRNRRVTA